MNDTQSASRQAASLSSAYGDRQFAIRTDSFGLLLPAEESVEYLVNATIYPIPRSMPRLLGLVNVRGHPVPVFDLSEFAGRDLPVMHAANVVIVGTESAALGFAGCLAPQAIDELTPMDGAVVPALLGDSATECYRDTVELRQWWAFDRSRFIDQLIAFDDPLDRQA